jgi:acyl-CoA hydrolase/GNAT superfamily N-acetyltransferase
LKKLNIPAYIQEMDLHAQYPQKVMSAGEAIARIKTGSRIFIGSACGEPQHLIHEMVRRKELQDIMIYQMLSFTLAKYIDDPSFMRRFFLKLFFISRDMRKAAFEGKIDYIPAYLSQIPQLFYGKWIGLDVALIQVSPPDKNGYCSLGVSVDITRAGMSNASLVIGQVNRHMPATRGDSHVHMDDLDCVVPYDEPIVQYSPATHKDSEVARRIGHYVSQLIDDGATLQIGFGTLPNVILQFLTEKKNLGVHTQVITDGFIPLLEQKVITCKKKNHLPGRIVASLCMGSQQLYDYVDNNPIFYFRSSDYVNDPNIIALNDNLISISSALEVDLTGQISSDSVGYRFYSGIGDQVDFLRGSAMSKGGFSIIALPSTAQNGWVSRIVPHLSEGAGVATTRGDVNFIVTEYGIAELQGKSIYQRVMEMTQIAHPRFRDKLIKFSKRRHYIFPDQLPPIQDDLMFIEEYKSTYKLKNNKTLEFRPILPSDEFSYRNFFYSLQEKTVFYRFFYKIKSFSHEVIQQHWASVDYRKNLSLIGLVMRGGHKEIIAIGSYAQTKDKDIAEVAFVVREDYQNMGIASYLMQQLEMIAKKNHYVGFEATILKENVAMLHAFKKNYPNLKIHDDDGVQMTLIMKFDDHQKTTK